MNDSEAAARLARASRTAPSALESSPGGDCRRSCTRHPANWAWATSYNQYDWMDVHTLSGELDPL